METSDLIKNVFLTKYAIKYKGKQETDPEEMFNRLADEFYRIEKDKYDDNLIKANNLKLTRQEIYDLFKDFKYLIGGGSVLFGVGNNDKYISLSNCFVVESPYDSYAGIMNTDSQLVNISKRRGGVGVCLDNIRPTGFETKNASKTSTGLIPFMKRFSNSINEVGQSGRRAALMELISVHHPEILNFIASKLEDGNITGANISVKLTDEFLSAVKNNTTYELRFPVSGPNAGDQYSEHVSAKDIWEKIIYAAWKRAEPGLLFWDNILNNGPAECYDNYRSVATNPCSELPLPEFDSCRLMAMNLFSFVVNPFDKNAYFDFDLYKDKVYKSQKMMDNLVDLESEKINKIINKIKNDPEPDYIKESELRIWENIKIKNEEGRRCGLGMLGIGDVFAALGIRYGSKLSIQLADKIGKTHKLAAYRASVDMAKVLGSFKEYDSKKELNNPFINRIKEEDPELYKDMVKYGRRNIACTTIAPTGSISILANTTSGIEPLFQQSYTRRRKLTQDDIDNGVNVDFIDMEGIKWSHYDVFHPKVKMWSEITGETDITQSPYYNCTADKIDWINRVKLQGVIQKHICSSISSTVNLPNNIDQETVAEIYKTAWEENLKGITVYRDGCRAGVLVNSEQLLSDHGKDAKKRPKDLECEIYHTNVTKKLDKIRTFKYMVMIGMLDGEPYEIFAIENGKHKDTIGKLVRIKRGHYNLELPSGEVIENITKDTTETEDALTRLVSTCLRHGVPIQYISEQLNKVQGELFCFSKSIARSLKKFIKNGTKSSEDCPKCKTKLTYENGCYICKNCGESKCS